MLNRLCNLQSDCGQSGAADGVREITGATPAYVAVSRHAAFSSLLSSLWGSPRFVGAPTYTFLQMFFRSLHI